MIIIINQSWAYLSRFGGGQGSVVVLAEGKLWPGALDHFCDPRASLCPHNSPHTFRGHLACVFRDSIPPAWYEGWGHMLGVHTCRHTNTDLQMQLTPIWLPGLSTSTGKNLLIGQSLFQPRLYSHLQPVLCWKHLFTSHLKRMRLRCTWEWEISDPRESLLNTESKK